MKGFWPHIYSIFLSKNELLLIKNLVYSFASVTLSANRFKDVTLNDNTKHDTTQTTHFGFQEVPVKEKAHKVAEVFHTVADKYDLMNDLMSLGIHRIWKRIAINLSGVQNGQTVLDIAGGTGDLASHLAKRVGKEGKIYLADINASMLEIGKDRLTDKGIIVNIEYVQADAENLPFPDNHFNCITIAFGLRNVTHKEAALAEMYRTLKPGGRLIILEFSKPVLPGLQPIYDAYSFKVLPFLGRCITDSAESYRYLAESIRKHPDQETLKKMLQTTGLSGCEYYNLSGGIVAIHRAHKA